MSVETFSYKEKANFLEKLSPSWNKLWKHHNHIPKALELGHVVNEITDFLTAYHHLFLGISLINEQQLNIDSKENHFQETLSGFLLLSQTIDTFIDIFSNDVLEQIYNDAKKVISLTYRNLKEYFQESIVKFCTM